MPKIQFQNVYVNFDERSVLKGINLELTQERIAIIGANGGGKSTLVRLINGLQDPSEGTVTVDGLDVTKAGKQVRQKVGFVFSDADNQIIMPTVGEDVSFSLRRLGLSKAERKGKAREILRQYGLDSHIDDSPHTLSGGQKQLLALASVLAVRPDVIIADEPTTLLDMRNRLMIAEVFKSLPQQLITVTHDLDFIQDFDRAILIHQNEVAADGAPPEVTREYVGLMESSAP